jgi:uncharacterized oxidoreductase
MQLTDNTIFITGSTSGIGRGLAEAFHRLGNKVIISGRRKALLDEVTAANPGMESISFDISDLASIEAAAEELVSRFPKLNVLVNNAGIMPFDDVSKPTDDVLAQSIINTNLLGPIRMTSALIEQLKSQPRSVIINNTSVVAYLPLANTAVYSATKAGLHSFTMSQRFMLRETSVRLQEIAPPWVDTDLIYKGGDPRSMPLDAYIAETMEKLAGDDLEVVVDAIKAVRDNPGAGEHAMFDAWNQAIVDEPIPTAHAA